METNTQCAMRQKCKMITYYPVHLTFLTAG